MQTSELGFGMSLEAVECKSSAETSPLSFTNKRSLSASWHSLLLQLQLQRRNLRLRAPHQVAGPPAEQCKACFCAHNQLLLCCNKVVTS